MWKTLKGIGGWFKPIWKVGFLLIGFIAFMPDFNGGMEILERIGIVKYVTDLLNEHWIGVIGWTILLLFIWNLLVSKPEEGHRKEFDERLRRKPSSPNRRARRAKPGSRRN